MEKGVSLVNQAKDFVRDIVIKTEFPSDGDLTWNSACLLRSGDVEVNFSVRFAPDNRTGKSKEVVFKARCHFCPSGLCFVQIHAKDGAHHPILAFFRDKGGSREFEFHGSRGPTRQGLYPITSIAP